MKCNLRSGSWYIATDHIGCSIILFITTNNDKEYEEGFAGTNRDRKSNPLNEYSDKEPMTPSKLNEGEPTVVKRAQTDQKVTSGGQTGTDTKEAQEEYRKRGMTKVD